MSRVLALFKNELIKISKKKSIIVLFILMIIGIIAIGTLMKIATAATDSYVINVDDGWNESQIKEEVDKYKSSIEDLKQQIQNAQEPAEKNGLEYEAAYNQMMIDTLGLAAEKEISIYSGSTYLSEAFNKVQYYRQCILQTQYQLSEEPSNLEYYKEMDTKLTSVLENKNYSEYLDIIKQEAENNKEFSAEEKDIEIRSIELLGKADPKGDSPNTISDAINRWKNLKKSLLFGIDYLSYSQQNTLLSSDQQKEYENQAAVIEYKLENAYYVGGNDNISTSAISAMVSTGLFITIILVIILAGGTFSQEISSGSIKSLIISPTKRWKIFAAKFLAMFIVGLISIVITYIISLAASAILFGTDAMTPYVYAANTQVHTMSFGLYQLLDILVRFIDVFVFMAFAFMLSILTKNTAASVGISMGVYFAGSTLFEVLKMFFTGKWLNFIPFSNLSLNNKIFPYSSSAELNASYAGNSAAQAGTSLTFSLVYLAVLVFCMMWIAHDSFTRKDL